MAAGIDGRTYVFAPNPLGFQALANYLIGSNTVTLDLHLSGAMGAGAAGQYKLLIGLDGRYRVTTKGPRNTDAALRGAWIHSDSFEINYVEPSGANRFNTVLRFTSDRLEALVSDRTGLYGSHQPKASVVD